MSAHECHQCGHLCRCGHGNWADRHPWPTAVSTALLGVLTLSTLCTHPFVVLPAVALAAVVYVVDREHRRRAALAARADDAHALLMATWQDLYAPLPQACWDHGASAPTTPLRTQGAN